MSFFQASSRCLVQGLLLGFGLATSLAAQIQIVSTTPTLAFLARSIGGDLVTVSSVMRGPENPHNIMATPSLMKRVKRADLFVHSGLDAEPWAPLVLQGARRAELLSGGLGNLNTSAGITLKEIPPPGQLDPSQGYVHAYGNPHYMLDPLNGLIVARTLADELVRRQPAAKADIDRRFQEFSAKVRVTTERLVAAMKPYEGTKVVTYHRAWPYFLDRFGLVRLTDVEPKPGITPFPAHLDECIQLMRTEGVKIVIVETYSSVATAEFVAKRAGGRSVVLAHEVGAVPGTESYEALFEHNVKMMLQAFEAAGVQPTNRAGERR